MVIKLRAAGVINEFEPFVQYQYGIKDYPFHQLRVGLAYNFVFKKLKGKDDSRP
jgi:hypothetical protein